MPRGSPEQKQARREEILDACAKLYEIMEFREITIKDVAAYTSFTRPSVYNYFQTKEEIFLGLLQREYEEWIRDVDALEPAGSGDGAGELAEGLARTLGRRTLLLKLLANNLGEMERNSRLERLVEFKVVYGASLQAIRESLRRFCPEMSEQRREEFLLAFLPFVYGLYPYSAVSEKQKAAMEQAGVSWQEISTEQLALLGIRALLRDGGAAG